jgi:hypothetical protein
VGKDSTQKIESKYLMKSYGKEATAYYSLFDGLRYWTRGRAAMG